MDKKIVSLDGLALIAQDLKKQGKIIVHCHGVFDLIHIGHIKYFQAAKKRGDALIVTVTPDAFVNKGPGRPVFNQTLRLESVAALECVDFVALNDRPTAVELLQTLKPDIYVKGGEFAEEIKDPNSRIFKESLIVKSYGGEVYLTNEPVSSSSHLINEYFDAYPEETKKFLSDFRSRYSLNDILAILDKIRNLKILVIGDAIIDKYEYCKPMDRSMKEEIPMVRLLNAETFAGGVMAVANTLATFCENVDLVTCLGSKNKDGESVHNDFIKKNLANNIKTAFFYRKNVPTVVNSHFTEEVFLKKFFGTYEFEELPLEKSLENQIANYLEDIIPTYDFVIAADYGLGFINKQIAGVISARASFLAVNTQANSANMGFNFIVKYPHRSYACISEPELRLAFHSKYSPIEKLVSHLKQASGAKLISITLGHLGSLTCVEDNFYKVPVVSRKVVDRIGASDAYLALTAPLAFLNVAGDVLGFLGNIAGAISANIVGYRERVDVDKVVQFTRTLLK